MVAEEPYPKDVLYVDGGEGTTPKPLFWIEPQLLKILARVLRENHPDISIGFKPGPTRRPVLTDEQHMLALATIDRVNPIRMAARARMARVSTKLGAALRDGQLKFALLPQRGGEFLTDTKPFWWNVQSVAHRWMRCQMSPSEPYSAAFSGDRFMHIFVDGADFSSFVESQRKAVAVAATPMHPSNNETYAAALALLSSWSTPKRTLRAFESLCRESGISSHIAREAYKTLGASRGRKRA